jgi:flagellar biosynthesis/type III secretory pathway protein FliH
MKIRAEDKIRIVADFFASLAAAEAGDREKELVSGFFSVYQPLDEKENLKLNEHLGKLKPEEKEKVMRLTNPFIEQGKREGIREGLQRGKREGIREGIREGSLVGRREGQVEIVLSLLKCRVGDFPTAQEKKIRKLDLSQIGMLGKSLLEFESREDLTRWLKQNAS